MSPKTKKILCVSGALALLLYVVIGCIWAHAGARSVKCAGLEGDRVAVDDPSGSGFIMPDTLTAELAPMLGNLADTPVGEVNLVAIKKYLDAMEKIEKSEVLMLNNNRLRIRVTPMVPVARIWPESGKSYYVNRDGKRVVATSRYKTDVPHIRGNFPAGSSPERLMPLLDYLNSNPDMNKMITMISAADTSNIILVPAVRGHVINLGDASNVYSKFSRLRAFYSKVMPVKGWTFYDTISLKWDGQVVATRRRNKLPDLRIPVDSVGVDDVAIETMQTVTR